MRIEDPSFGDVILGWFQRFHFSTLKMKEDEAIIESYFQVFSYPESPRQLFFDGFFQKDYCFSKSVQSTIPREYSALMVGLTSKGYVFFLCGAGGLSWNARELAKFQQQLIAFRIMFSRCSVYIQPQTLNVGAIDPTIW